MAPRYRVLVIGGYGLFGRRLVERLARLAGLHIVVAGRSLPMARALVSQLQGTAAAELSGAALDVHSPGFEADLSRLGVQAVVHTSGPFQGQDYRVARACMACGAHYVDLADGREFVAGIGVLADAARQAGVAVVSGASSVPALSSAAVDHLTNGWLELHNIDIGISPGNRTERGLSTVQAILSYCGQPLAVPSPSVVFGWSGTWRHAYPAPVGTRLLSPCDVPDLALLPGRYPGTPAVRFGAGLELPFLHRGMNLMALLARWGWVHNWARYARPLTRVADAFKGWGSDAGAMHVIVTGIDAGGHRVSRTWHLVATRGDGPYVPTLATAAWVRWLMQGAAVPKGAWPCIGLLSLKEIAEEAAGLCIEMGEGSP